MIPKCGKCESEGFGIQLGIGGNIVTLGRFSSFRLILNELSYVVAAFACSCVALFNQAYNSSSLLQS